MTSIDLDFEEVSWNDLLSIDDNESQFDLLCDILDKELLPLWVWLCLRDEVITDFWEVAPERIIPFCKREIYTDASERYHNKGERYLVGILLNQVLVVSKREIRFGIHPAIDFLSTEMSRKYKNHRSATMGEFEDNINWAERPYLNVDQARVLLAQKDFVLTIEKWNKIQIESMGEYWFSNPELIRNFLAELEVAREGSLVFIESSCRTLLAELRCALALGMDSFWIDYVEGHRKSYADRKFAAWSKLKNEDAGTRIKRLERRSDGRLDI